ncbi:hypothetical protein Esti_002464 [Eimeria stiedai]
MHNKGHGGAIPRAHAPATSGFAQKQICLIRLKYTVQSQICRLLCCTSCSPTVDERAVYPTSGRLVLPMADDMHTHLRQGRLMDLVASQIRRGGCDRVLVMPNTVPPIVTCSQALTYRNELLKIEPRVDYLMTLYLSPAVDPKDLAENAKKSHVQGVKLYPRGVTTNSGEGVEDLTVFYKVFETMQSRGLSLHIHGERVGAPPLRAEEEFLPVFEDIHSRFPDLKIIFEHVSTAKAIRAIKGKPNVAATITAHHLQLTIDDVFSPESVSQHLEVTEKASTGTASPSHPHNFCKPIAKFREDRDELIRTIQEGNPQFFLGSDSAPHPRTKKDAQPPAAGVFTQPFLLAYLVDIFSRAGCLDKLRGFICEHAAAFFELPRKELVEGQDCIVLEPTPCTIPSAIGYGERPEDQIVPFLAGQTLGYTVSVVPFTKSLLSS